jgi:hypothetical protein
MQSPWHSEQSVLKEGHVLRGGQVPVQMFVHVSQSASECCPERGRMQSRLAAGPGNLMYI